MLTVWGVSLALQWETFKWIQVPGFALLVYGSFVYNRVIPFVYKFKADQEKEAEME